MKQLVLCMAWMLVAMTAAAQHQFHSLDSLLSYARTKSIVLKSGSIQLVQAKQAKLAAILSIPDVSGNIAGTYTHNTRLPVSLFPAEIFGGQPGTFREVQTGIPYTTNINETVDIKLLNLKGWENLRLSRLNIQSTEANNKFTLKSLEENIAASYYNIINLQQQALSVQQNITAADTLLQITRNKYDAGLVKQQDVNDAEINYLTNKENLRQIEYLLRQQYLSLKLLCDIPEQEPLIINEPFTSLPFPDAPYLQSSHLLSAIGLLQEKNALVNYKVQKAGLYPTVSFFQAYTTQQFSTSGKLFDRSINWIPSSYIGIRISIPIPSANTITQISKAKYDYLLAQKNTEQQKIKEGLEEEQLRVEYIKALSQAKSNNSIHSLRKDTYEKNLSLYREGLQNLDQTLNSFNQMVSSSYNAISAQVTVMAVKAKIEINNRIQ